MRIMMIVASGLSYLVNEAIAKARYGNADKMNFETPLTLLVWLTSLVSVGDDLRRLVPAHPRLGDGGDDDACGGSSRRIITCGTLAGAIIPEVVKVFTSTDVRARPRGRHRVARRRRVAQRPRRPHRR